MEKQKRITLNADKRKVIADVFQDHFESNSKFKKAHQDAIDNYNGMRTIAKTKIDHLIRFHQPQEDVDTIRSMISKYGSSGGDLYHDNCFYVQSDKPRIEKDYDGNPKEYFDDVHIKFEADKDFLISYYRDEIRAKGLDADFDVRLADNYDKRNPTYYNTESSINDYLGYGSRNDVSKNQTMKHKDEWVMISNFGLLELLIVILVSLLQIKKLLNSLRVLMLQEIMSYFNIKIFLPTLIRKCRN